MKTFNARFDLGDRVNHVTEPTHMAGIVISITFFPGGMTYTVQWSASESRSHYELELLPV